MRYTDDTDVTCECGGQPASLVNQVVVCACHPASAKPDLCGACIASECVSTFTSLHSIWLLAARIIMTALDDAIGCGGNLLGSGAHAKKYDSRRTTQLSNAGEAQVWLMTESPERDIWFRVLGIKPPTPSTIIPILCAWQIARRAEVKYIDSKILGSFGSVTARKKKREQTEDDKHWRVDSGWDVTYPAVDATNDFWYRGSHPVFSIVENGEDGADCQDQSSSGEASSHKPVPEVPKLCDVSVSSRSLGGKRDAKLVSYSGSVVK